VDKDGGIKATRVSEYYFHARIFVLVRISSDLIVEE